MQLGLRQKKIYKILKTLLVSIAIVISTCPYPQATATTRQDCMDVQFVFARGSGEKLGGQNARAWEANIRLNLQPNTTLKYAFYELGSAKQGGFQYPAVAVGENAEGMVNLAGAIVASGAAYDFGNSVVEGSAELRNFINDISHRCPKTKFVLGGYSQGAMVISKTLPELDARRIIYVTTFGDPKLYLPEGEGLFPAACRGEKISEYRIDVADCRAYEGVLGSYRPYQPANYYGKLGTWCNNHDAMCSSHWSLEDHTSYASSGKYRRAAEVIADKIQVEYPKLNIKTIKKSNSGVHNVAFLMDTTGSMESMLEKYRAEARKIAQEVLRTGGKIALISYRDLSDPYDPVLECDFQCNYAQFNSRISKLSTGGGGDRSESALSAMMLALNRLEWENGATKSMIILTDSPYKNPDVDGTTMLEVAKRSLEIDPVNAYIITNRTTVDEYLDLANSMDGAVYNISEELTFSTEQILQRPVALLSQMEYYGKVSDKFHFDASDSYILNGHNNEKQGLQFDWDLDGDGRYEVVAGPSQITQQFRQPGESFVRLRTTDPAGRRSTMSAKVTVVDHEAQPALITDLKVLQANNGYKIEISTTGKRVLVLLNDAVLGFLPAEHGKAQFSLTDLRGNTTLQFIPFDSQDVRGEAKKIMLGPNESVLLNQPNPTSSSEGDQLKKILPKVPNSGVVISS